MNLNTGIQKFQWKKRKKWINNKKWKCVRRKEKLCFQSKGKLVENRRKNEFIEKIGNEEEICVK